jgi:hypothetical protein
MKGDEILQLAKEHVLQTMSTMPECRKTFGDGAGSRLIEQKGDLDLLLRAQNGWLTWSLLMSLLQEGRVELVQGNRLKKFRLK